MCTPWWRFLLMLGVLGSFWHPMLAIIIVLPIGSWVLARVLHRDIWPTQYQCRLPDAR